jgi:ATP-dependent protease ClpP protease subunit
MPLNLDRRPALLRKPAAKPAAAASRRPAARVQSLAPGHILLDLYGDICPGGIEAAGVLGVLRATDVASIEVRISSRGGDAWDGLAIYNDLRSIPARCDVIITGIAGSAASIIAMAGATIRMEETAQIFIHNAWVECAGNAKYLEKLAAELHQTDTSMARIYAARTGIPEDQIRALMDAETLLTAAEALDLGFCDKIIRLDCTPKAVRSQNQPQAATCKRRLQAASLTVDSGRAADDLLDIAAGLRSLITTQNRR